MYMYLWIPSKPARLGCLVNSRALRGVERGEIETRRSARAIAVDSFCVFVSVCAWVCACLFVGFSLCLCANMAWSKVFWSLPCPPPPPPPFPPPALLPASLLPLTFSRESLVTGVPEIYVYTYTYIYTQIAARIVRCDVIGSGWMHALDYGVAMISRLLKITGLFCRISSLVFVSFAKETYNFKEPTSRSHPIAVRFGGACLTKQYAAMRIGGLEWWCVFLRVPFALLLAELAFSPQVYGL